MVLTRDSLYRMMICLTDAPLAQLDRALDCEMEKDLLADRLDREVRTRTAAGE